MTNNDFHAKVSEIKKRRLRVLQEQQAYFGVSTPPHILMEIEDLESELGEIASTSAASAPASVDARTERLRELRSLRSTYVRRIMALQEDLSRTLDDQRRAIIEDRLLESMSQVDKTTSEIESIERQLNPD